MEVKDNIDELISNIKEYAETRYDIALINIQDKISDMLSSFAVVIITSVSVLFVLLFVSLGAAWWIGHAIHHPSVGFLCVAVFYMLFGILIYTNREKWIKFPIINTLLKKINIHEED